MTSTDREILLDISGRLVRIESRLEGVELRLERVESRLDGLESRVVGVESRLDGVESRMVVMEHHNDIAMSKIEGVQSSVNWVFAGISILLGISTVFLAMMQMMSNRKDTGNNGLTLSDVIALLRYSRKDDEG